MAKKTHCTIEQFDHIAREHVAIVQSIVAANVFEFRYEDIVLFGENQKTREMQSWLDRILVSASEPVTCRLWKNDVCPVVIAASTVVAPTAVECCSMMIRQLYLQLFSELPVRWASIGGVGLPFLFSVDLPIPETMERMKRFILESADTLGDRLCKIRDAMNTEDWLRVCALSSVEHTKLLVDADEDDVSPSSDRKRGNWSDDPSNRPPEYEHGPIDGKSKIPKCRGCDGLGTPAGEAAGLICGACMGTGIECNVCED